MLDKKVKIWLTTLKDSDRKKYRVWVMQRAAGW